MEPVLKHGGEGLSGYSIRVGGASEWEEQGAEVFNQLPEATASVSLTAGPT